jgi:predicted RND superfamily exporter protein
LDKIISSIIKHKKTTVTLFIVFSIICVFLFLLVSVNYDITSYLPKEAKSTISLDVMKEEFEDSIPNTRMMVENVSLAKAIEYKNTLKSIEGVSDVIWLDDIIDLKQPIEYADRDLVEQYYKDEAALYNFVIRDGDEVETIERIQKALGEDHAYAGSAVESAFMQKLTGSETTKAMFILVPIILLILLVSTDSWLEPLLFLITIGGSVIINMGTGIIFGEVSYITSAVSPILQLAVSLDYAIFLLHSFSDYRKETDNLDEAMLRAVKRSIPAIAASALTTLFGFLALTFMKFRIGPDLGINLAKGVLLSFLSVIVVLPSLTLVLSKSLDKTRHRPLLPSFSKFSKFLSKLKVPVFILIILITVPAFLAQSNSKFVYGPSDLGKGSKVAWDKEKIEDRFGASTPIVLLTPRGEVTEKAKLEEMTCDLEQIEHVTQVVSYSSMVGSTIPDEYLDSEITKTFYSDNYSRTIVYADTPTEGDIAFSVVEKVQETAAEYYGEAYYSLGSSVNLLDMKNIVSEDNNLVNIIAIAAIFLVIMVTYRSLSIPILLVLTIETAIWINLAIPYFNDSSLNFLGYLVVNTVQLGATVDYAILFTDNYVENRKILGKKQALSKTYTDTLRSILVSASILASASFSLALVSTNSIVSELGMLLGRGTLLSLFMVVLFLPALLTIFDGFISKTTMKANFLRESKYLIKGDNQK